MARSCPVGKIRRKAYTRKGYRRKDGTRVKATRVSSDCIADRGKPGKGPKILPKPKKGHLYGWKKDKSAASRHRSIMKAVSASDCGTAIRRLTLLENISDDPGTDRAVAADKNWLERQSVCRVGPKALSKYRRRKK